MVSGEKCSSMIVQHCIYDDPAAPGLKRDLSFTILEKPPKYVTFDNSKVTVNNGFDTHLG